jgi:hypothetical protein
MSWGQALAEMHGRHAGCRLLSSRLVMVWASRLSNWARMREGAELQHACLQAQGAGACRGARRCSWRAASRYMSQQLIYVMLLH